MSDEWIDDINYKQAIKCFDNVTVFIKELCV